MYRFIVLAIIAILASCKKDNTLPSVTTINVITTLASNDHINNDYSQPVMEGESQFLKGIVYANINDDEKSELVTIGVCWDTHPEPTINDFCVFETPQTGQSSIKLYGLRKDTKYYVRAYATTENGASYGEEIEVFGVGSFLPNNSTDTNTETFQDPRDGNIYKIVTIGDQVWMAENLRYLPSVAGTGNLSTSTPYYFVYGYNGTNTTEAKVNSNFKTYGVLYNWTAAINACPPGWHLPTDAEWTLLVNSLGGENIAGGKLKEIGISHWLSPNYGATNEKFFSALPGGVYGTMGGIFSYIGTSGYWWTGSENDESTAYFRSMNYSNSNTTRDFYNKQMGLSIRCVKD